MRSIDAWTANGAMFACLVLALAALAAGAGPEVAGPDPYRGVTFANTTLAGSTVLYLVYLWFRAEPVGCAASTLAGAGAIGVLTVVGLGSSVAQAGSIRLYESTALLSAAAVLAYLALERVYRNRSAGIVVMPGVMVTVLCEMWLINSGLAPDGVPAGGLGTYWEAGHRFAFCLGYCPLAVAAILALRERSPGRGTGVDLRGTMLAAMSVGTPLLLLGAGMGAVGAIVADAGAAGGHAAVGVSWLVAGLALVTWVRVRRAADPRLPRNCLLVFAVATAGLMVSRAVALAF